MNSITLLRRLHQHRTWVNRRLLDSVRNLNDEQLHRRLAIGQGSVWKTLTHLAAAEFVWLEAILGNESPVMPGDLPGQLPGNQQAPDRFQSLKEFEAFWQDLMTRWETCLQSLTEESLGQIVYKVSTSSAAGQRQGTSRADVLLHVCTHAQYTTAQLLNMLRQLQVGSLPDVMLITLAREEQETRPT